MMMKQSSGAASRPQQERIAPLELVSGQCTVVQCNHDVGRALIRSITGEDAASPGQVLYKGKPLLLTDPDTAKLVGFCGLEEGIYRRLKVREYLQFWARLYDATISVQELLGVIGLEEKAEERISRLSDSEKRLLGFARSIVHDPELVIWEEPEQNLDLHSCMVVRRLIDELIRKDKAVLITCSTLEQALSISNRIFHLTGDALTPITVQEAAEYAEPEASRPEQSDSETQAVPDSDMKLARLMVKTEDKYVFVDPQDIRYIESNEGATSLFTTSGAFACAWTLSELEEKLKPYRFYRCHRSYIVRLDVIAELIVWSRNSYSLVLDDDKRSRIPLSKGKFEELKGMVGL
ncbi:LytTR family transcriptional regulator DNA-binding domain-containing protein [Paenibacillus sp. PAMC21692]|uniref:LytTR family transcriptional regulator DNA-binding domain-containing protein n=1 Tax=Paenibacillus sp. PAMC21692 TaxID=2762320 RepID=UPI00164E354C|nr:LytTR family transcriptional regulator DNA-binding domain-containing protein [Paenibacillus sp. PAMC21692]QNK57863.1 LytTR family transcriptional regulator DNA-binding domain-containing protein [Paenibacillus sp. PAMC21692]